MNPPELALVTEQRVFYIWKEGELCVKKIWNKFLKENYAVWWSLVKHGISLRKVDAPLVLLFQLFWQVVWNSYYWAFQHVSSSVWFKVQAVCVFSHVGTRPRFLNNDCALYSLFKLVGFRRNGYLCQTSTFSAWLAWYVSCAVFQVSFGENWFGKVANKEMLDCRMYH